MSEILEKPARPRGRPRGFDVDAALDGAIDVFSRKGYHGTSIGDLTDALGLTAGSLYKAFGDKRGILLGAFERYRLLRSARLKNAISGDGTGREKLRAAILSYADSAHGEQGRRGCFVISMTSELASYDPAIADKVSGAHAANEAVLKGLVRLGQADGSVSSELDASDTARALLCGMIGMRVIGKTGRDRADMIAAGDILLKLLD